MKYANSDISEIMDTFDLNVQMINSGKLSKEELQTIIREQRKIKKELERRRIANHVTKL